MSSGGGGGGSWIGGMLSAMGAGVSAEGQITGGKAEAAALRYNADVADINARLATQTAEYDARQIRRLLDKTEGGQKASYAASGVSADSGSALDVLSDTVAQGTLAVQRREFAGKLEAMGYTAEAARARVNAKAVIWNSKMAAFGTKLNGAASFFGSSGGYSGGYKGGGGGDIGEHPEYSYGGRYDDRSNYDWVDYD